MKKLLFSVIIALAAFEVFAQPLDYQNIISVILSDGTNVIMYGRAGDERMPKRLSVSNNLRTEFSSNASGKDSKFGVKVNSKLPDLEYFDDYYATGEYYYLPTNLRLSKRPDGVPEFLFLKYTTEQRADAGGVQGALMHFLMEWGLTPEQEKEAAQLLDAKFQQIKTNSAMKDKYVKAQKATLLGPVKLNAGDESFRIISATLTDKNLAPTLVSSGKAPTMPGQKSAVASNLSKNGAQLLAATFEKNRSITDVSIELRFKYNVLMPSFKGSVVVDYSKLETMYKEKYSKAVNKENEDRWLKDDADDDELSITSREALIENLMEAKVVDISFTDMGGNPEITKTLTEAVMNMIVASLETTQEQAPQRRDGEEDDKNDKVNENVRRGTTTIDMKKLRAKMARKKEVINLNYRMTLTEEVAVLGNLGSWYDGVRNNSKCVSAVNLNDPFFQHRDINLILDMDAERMFGQEVNFVTVNVRKRRTAGNPFQEQVTIDRNYLKDKGVKATVTYARGEDKNSDVYEYKSQWSLRGGKTYPDSPQWIKGDWQGVTLDAPIKPRSIQFEADLDELKQMGITRATLQLRYYKFGEEIESNIPLTVSKGVPLVEDMIFTDKDQQGYVYRLILTHKEKGKLALPWESKINDDYVFATIPDKLRNNDDKFIDLISEAGKMVITPNPDGSVPLEAKILDSFKEILKLIKK